MMQMGNEHSPFSCHYSNLKVYNIMDIQYDNYENMKENLLLTLFIPEFFTIEKWGRAD